MLFNKMKGARAVLLLIIVYCVDGAWKLAHWRELVRVLPWWSISDALTLRFAFMGATQFC